MIPDGLITYSPHELERIAVDLFRRRPDVDFSAPINVEALVENTKNVSLEFVDGLRDTYHVEGAVSKIYMSREILVQVDHSFLSRPWSRYNEVLGEEFAHIHIHPGLFNFVNSIEDFIDLQRDVQWARYESDAKRLSAIIRMPAQLVVRAAEEIYPRIVREFGFSDLANVEKLLRNDLALKFRVSPAQMQQRIADPPCAIRTRLASSFVTASTDLMPAERLPFDAQHGAHERGKGP